MVETGASLVELSLLDRLLDDDPATSREPTKTHRQAMDELRNAIRRDLEALLNTRPCSITWPRGLSELDSSILNYGMVTVSSQEMAADYNRERFRESVERVIRRFEPRFLKVEVTLIDDTDRTDRTLRFRIEAMMDVRPAPEPLVFDSLLDPSTQGVTVGPPRDV
jgi:type VI secretion system protein ImpF